MSTYIINGGKPLHGTVTPLPNKNAILPLICAAVLTDEPVTFHNVPKSPSVRIMLQIFRDFGGKVAYLQGDSVRLTAASMDKFKISKELAKKEKASLMFLGPLLTRFGRAELEEAGGCKLGSRPIDTLYQGLIELGAKVNPDNIYDISVKQLTGKKIWQLETSVTGTENLVIAATLAKGTTEIYNAACEPHVQDVCNFLNSIGAKISGVGTNKIVVEGVEKLGGGEWTVIPDHIDIGGLIVAAAITGGKLRIKNAIPDHMEHILMFYRKFNLNVEIDGQDLVIPAEQELIAKPTMKGDIDNIKAQPWPTAFPADLIPQALVLGLMAKGTMYIMNNMYQNQLLFVEELIKLRGNVILADPTKAITYGPSQMKGAIVTAPDILQAGHALALAGFAARGTTKIQNVDMVKRRFPNFVETMKALGGDITEVK